MGCERGTRIFGASPPCIHARCRWDDGRLRGTRRRRIDSSPVVLFFEIVLVLAVVVISWFTLYTLYRLITDES